jgi:hypothetical protein
MEQRKRFRLGALSAVMRGLIALLSVSALIGVGRAEEFSSCPYCADWKPLSGHRFLSADVLIVRKDQVALPGCAGARATFLQEREHPSIHTETGLPPALLVYYRLEESPNCSPSIAGVESGALLELQYVPTRTTGGGKVELRVLHAHDIPARERTGASVQWFAIRFDNN